MGLHPVVTASPVGHPQRLVSGGDIHHLHHLSHVKLQKLIDLASETLSALRKLLVCPEEPQAELQPAK
eukprot:4129491-Prorocentrum_lima.AAC.1